MQDSDKFVAAGLVAARGCFTGYRGYPRISVRCDCEAAAHLLKDTFGGSITGPFDVGPLLRWDWRVQGNTLRQNLASLVETLPNFVWEEQSAWVLKYKLYALSEPLWQFLNNKGFFE